MESARQHRPAASNLVRTFLLPRLAIVTVLLALAGAAIAASLWADWQKTIKLRDENFIQTLLSRELEGRKNHLERLFDNAYHNVRTISLLPSIRKIGGRNRSGEGEDIVAGGRLSQDAFNTVQQIYNNIADDFSVSEIYAVIDGLNYRKGEIPFFMFDELIFGGNPSSQKEEGATTRDTPEELEDEEYAYFPSQIAQLKSQHPRFDFNNIDAIPAAFSPMMRTCDNTQYTSVSRGDVHDAYGLLYSVPFYHHPRERAGSRAAGPALAAAHRCGKRRIDAEGIHPAGQTGHLHAGKCAAWHQDIRPAQYRPARYFRTQESRGEPPVPGDSFGAGRFGLDAALLDTAGQTGCEQC